MELKLRQTNMLTTSCSLADEYMYRVAHEYMKHTPWWLGIWPWSNTSHFSQDGDRGNHHSRAQQPDRKGNRFGYTAAMSSHTIHQDWLCRGSTMWQLNAGHICACAWPVNCMHRLSSNTSASRPKTAKAPASLWGSRRRRFGVGSVREYWVGGKHEERMGHKYTHVKEEMREWKYISFVC